jgi:DNA helicase-2/ATP-dependent DNA helicase PcrA
LLVDESQDTQKGLVDAFFALQAQHSNEFSLFMFGDTMQRIYADGKIGLEQAIPAGWERPAITINYRCPKRIVRLLNKIRADADGQKQEPREDAQEGVVRLFIVGDTDSIDKRTLEAEAARRMAEIAFDDRWTDWPAVKVLTLEHHMAARRGNFNGFFEPLYTISNFRTGLLDGSLSGVSFFARQVLPLVRALQANDRFAIAQAVKDNSSIVAPDKLSACEAPLEEIRKAGCSVQSVFSLWDNGADPALIDVLKVIADNGLFTVPDVFAPILHHTNTADEKEDAADENNPTVDAWREALSAPFSQFESYVEYISDRSPYGTHQGIKGLQFPRVMVILDDNEARGFMFSYDKLLGAKVPSGTDEKNRQEGKETTIERTRRLFYVTCSRAQDSLAIVVYTKEAKMVADYLTDIGWFKDDEIIRL